MKSNLQLCVPTGVLAFLAMSLAGCSCGFDCNNERQPGNQSTLLSLGFSDESLEQLKAVVIEVDSITFRRSGAQDVIVDTFTIDELGLTGSDTFQMDLLQYRGLNQLMVVEALEMQAATYSEVQVSILGGDVNRSYVQESNDSLSPIRIDGGVLTLPGPRLSSGDQTFTLAFGLAQALQFEPATADYLLTTQGVRLLDNATSASLSGRVDSMLFDTTPPCDAKNNPEAGNRVYLYPGRTLPADDLADVFTGSSTKPVPDNALAPYSVASVAEDVLTGSWQYSFGFLPAGDYTLAFSCDAANDNPVDYDGFTIPLPSDQVYEVQLSESEKAVCDLAEEASCS